MDKTPGALPSESRRRSLAAPPEQGMAQSPNEALPPLFRTWIVQIMEFNVKSGDYHLFKNLSEKVRSFQALGFEVKLIEVDCHS